MNLKYYSLIALLFSTLVFYSCNELDLAPVNRFTEENYWTSVDKASMVLSTAYSQMYNSEFYHLGDAMSDNAYEGLRYYDSKIISSGQADAGNGRFSNEWSQSYTCVKTCHILLENIDRVPNMDEGLKTRMKAEARFLRAFEFFRLIMWFGDVPFFTKDITLSESQTIPQTPKSEILKFVYDEFDEVASILPAKQGYTASDNGRITSGAAMAMKARACLYNDNWTGAVDACEKIINTATYGQYALFPSYAGLFHPSNEYNDEVILDLGYVPVLRTWSDYYDWVPISVGAREHRAAPTQELVDSYLTLNGLSVDQDPAYDEENPYVNRDPRLTATVVYHGYEWTNPNGSKQIIYTKPGTAPNANAKVDEYDPASSVASSTGYYSRKYFDPTYTGNFNAGLNLILLRYADVLLMYAEAKNELGQMTEAIWNATVKPIRQRAGFTVSAALDYDASWSQSDLKEIIRRERRCELALENLRLPDIRRWKIAEIVMNAYPHGAKYGDPAIDNGYIRCDYRTFDPTRDYLWAIPQAQRDLNPNLKQNPNY